MFVYNAFVVLYVSVEMCALPNENTEIQSSKTQLDALHELEWEFISHYKACN